MYLLVVVVIVAGVHLVKPIAKFPSDLNPCTSTTECYTACKLEATRIADAMHQSYPGDTDYYLVCKLVKPVVGKGVNL
jgi:hypothetical protein